ncbi:transposase [Sulfobacillus harzensis]|uniref:Transposase n=1 Tax=Sulfobacillus harzensis TaxID=2729629 RepID=A0A7Y0Q238_9FIRM|nr:transposase [Sulfobacillus harzensis]NMP22773.1 transposase [Sulfobacillus harzensis]
MLRSMMTDAQIWAQIEADLATWNDAWGAREAWEKETRWSLTATFDAQAEAAQSRYASDRGRPARDPFQLLRALALMTVRQIPSLVDGVAMLRQSVWLCHLCGWESPREVPAVSTFYGFLRRMYPEERPRHGAMRRSSGRRLKLKRGQKMPTRRPGAIGRVATRVQREAKRGRRAAPGDLWDRFLADTSRESVDRGVLPPVWDLAVDGSPIESGASSFGAKRCTCSTRGCGCLRYFSDPMALVGWDSHRNRYYFGYDPSAMVVVNTVPGQPSHPLIVSFALHPANRHDGVALPDLLVKTQGLYATPTIAMHHLIGDAAYDVQALWDLTRQRGLIPAFAPGQPLEPPHVSDEATAAGITLSDTHQPICRDARPMPRMGQPRPGVMVYGCPLRKKSALPCPNPCDKAMKTVTVNGRGSRYTDSGVPYGTPEWTTLYNERTGVERAFSLWTAHGIKAAHHRRPYLWYARLALAAIVSHHEAWVRTAA